MLILLSPAKKLLSFIKPYLGQTSLPVFEDQGEELAGIMRDKSIQDIAKLMHISNNLAELNYQRYQSFHTGKASAKNSWPAVFLFQGDVYKNLKPELWDKTSLDFAQTHLAILSGLYGLLRPLDRIQPYRLEMGTHLTTPSGNNLYAFWSELITRELNNRLATHKNPLVVNLASTEYFHVINRDLLNVPVLTIHFKEQKGTQLKVIGIQAKKARGAMADYIIRHRIEDIEPIKEFTLLNYKFCKHSSDIHDFTFIRAF